MKNFRYLLLILICASCLTEVPIELQAPYRKYSVNSILCTDNVARAYVSISIPSNSSNYYENIENANITITENNTITYKVELYTSEYYGNYYKGDFIPKPGTDYTIEVISSDNTTLTSETSIPEIVNIDTFYLQKGIPEYEEDNITILKIKFTDPGNQTNYYMVGYSIWGSKNKYYYDPIYGQNEPERGFVFEGYHFMDELSSNIVTNEPLIGKINYDKAQILCFNDILINGSSYTLSIGFRDIAQNRDYKSYLIVPKLYSINEATYQYFESVNVASNNYDSFIAEPIKQFTNINGGLGFFGGMAMASDTLFIMKEDLY